MNSMILRQSERLAEALKDKDQKIVTAESCTAGGVAYAITCIPGSSRWFEGSFVTYSNEAKKNWLQVTQKDLEVHGAVSEPVVHLMALGALQHTSADYAAAISGVAGPDGGTDQKPVGTVWFSWADRNQNVKTKQYQFDGNRAEVREQSIVIALQGLVEWAIQL
ncbi:MAG: CinA family protein [Pseudomonadota bacterium]